MAFKATIIIPTWRRPFILNQVLNSISNQLNVNFEFEVIVVNSEIDSKTQEVLSRHQRLDRFPLSFVLIEHNTIAGRRNAGINESAGDYLIFLDDDCVPEANWLTTIISEITTKGNTRAVMCGGVRFPSNLVARSNYYRYRDSRHFYGKRARPVTLSFRQIVTMNMAIGRQALLSDDIRFDEDFKGYGFEDIEFGIKLQEHGYILYSSHADIIHQELNGDIKKFSKKFYLTGRDGMPVFLRKAPCYADQLGRSGFLEPINREDSRRRKIGKRLVNLLFGSGLPIIVEYILLHTDAISWLYCKKAYEIVLGYAYRTGRISVRTSITNDA